MSLILEALRKSEAERRRGMAPDVAMELPPTPITRPRRVAAWLLPALVVVVLLVLASWWARREPAKATSPHAAIEGTTVATQAPTNPVPAGMPRIEPKPATPVAARVSPPQIQLPALQAPAATELPAPKPVHPSTATPSPDVEVARPGPIQLRSTSDISNDTSMLPPIKLSMLMWDDVPSRRFVILNGQRMAEGDRYGDVTVLAIERNGIVVEGNGARARVPLP